MPFLTTLSTVRRPLHSISISLNSSFRAIPITNSSLSSPQCSSSTIACLSSSLTAICKPQLPRVDCQLLQITSNQLHNNSQFNLCINHQWQLEVQIHICMQDHIRIFRFPLLTFHNYNIHSNLRHINWDNNKWQWFLSSKYITSRVHLFGTTWTINTTLRTQCTRANTWRFPTPWVVELSRVRVSSALQTSRERQWAHRSRRTTCIAIIRWCHFK